MRAGSGWAAAFVLLQELRLAAAGTTFRRAQASTLRERLFKLGVWIKRSNRRILLHLPKEAPCQSEWCRIARNLDALETVLQRVEAEIRRRLPPLLDHALTLGSLAS